MKKYTITLFISILVMVSCSEKTDYGQPNVDSENIQKDYMEWWTYYNDNIILSSNFIAIDNSSKIISKEDFLKNLTSGDFIPLKLISKNATTYYQLFKLNKSANKDIGSTIKNTTQVVYKHYLMEGENFPKFSFKDLDGNEYNNENIKGKIVILKCWFIKCQACVAEFPELNELVEKYKNREDVIFLSLAFDTEDELNKFLINKPFNYKVASVERSFFDNELRINEYPTHFIIDKDGVIEKVVNTSKELFLELIDEGILNLDNTSTLSVPPPPAPPAPSGS